MTFHAARFRVKGAVRRTVAAVAVLTLAGSLASCAESQRDTPGGSSDAANDTFVFAASSDPVSLDPSLASDGETFRVARQIFEGLVSTVPGTLDLAPGLATKWTAASDGKTYTFDLREGVKFTDGTDFNGEAVCANFDRWYNWTGLNQNENISYYYGNIFKGFKTADDPDRVGGLYGGCTAPSANQAVITLTSPFAAFVQTMTLPAFSMQSPAAMEQYDADNTTGTETDTRFSEYATAHPTGTGPYKFDKWDRGQAVSLVRNDDYWGEKAKIAKVSIRTISDSKARTQALEAGEIDGYDLVGPADVEALKSKGYQIQNRPAFNILYLGMNQKNKALADIKVRQAISYAVDKEALLKQSLPAGSIAAKEFMPADVAGYNDDVETYDYDPAKAKALLAEAGQQDLTLNFAYPTGVSRPYMPTPEDTFAALKSQLEAVGITINPVAAKWSPDYLDLVQGPDQTDKQDLHLLGWTGDYDDPDNFVGVFFGKKSNQWGFTNTKLFADLDAARQLPTREEQEPAYEKINAEIATFIPGVPLAHPAPSLAFGKGVQGYTASPVQDEVWNTVTVTR